MLCAVKEAYDAVTQLVGDIVRVRVIIPVIVCVIVKTRDEVEVLEYTVPLTDTVCVWVMKEVRLTEGVKRIDFVINPVPECVTVTTTVLVPQPDPERFAVALAVLLARPVRVPTIVCIDVRVTLPEPVVFELTLFDRDTRADAVYDVVSVLEAVKLPVKLRFGVDVSDCVTLIHPVDDREALVAEALLDPCKDG